MKKVKPQKAHKVGPIRSAILAALGIPLSLTDPQGWASHAGHDSPAGVKVTAESALTSSTFWACVRLVSETVGTLPLNLYERTPTGNKVASAHPLQMVLHSQPNIDSSASMFWEAIVAAMMMRGNGRAEKLMSGPNLIGLSFLNPRRLQINCVQGVDQYRYTNENGTMRIIPPARIWNVPGFSLDGVRGVSVLKYMAAVLGNALAADDTASSLFKAGLKPTRYLKMKQLLTKSQREQYKESLENIKTSVDRGDVPVLEGDMDFGTIGMSPDDAQLLESRAWSVEEVCRFLRIDPSMVGHGGKDSNFGTGIEQKMIGFLVFTLAIWLRRIEQAIQKDLLTPTERLRYYPKFNVEGLLRADSAARAAFYSVMVNNGILTRDEVRKLEDLPPMGGNASVLTVQSAMTTLDSIGTASDANQARAAIRAFLGFKEDSQEG